MSTPDGARMLVTLTVAELQAVVAEAVVMALAEHEADRLPPPELVNLGELCRRLAVSRTTVHRLRTEGLPAVRVGETFRYSVPAVVMWLQERRQ